MSIDVRAELKDGIGSKREVVLDLGSPFYILGMPISHKSPSYEGVSTNYLSPSGKKGFYFYHSVVHSFLNTHDMNGSEELWELARRTYTSFVNAKNANKHLEDMAGLNFLMCQAIEEPMPDDEEANKINKELGIEDYFLCPTT